MPNEERPQDFELIELLIREAAASTSVQQSSGVDESFKARFQSYIDQISSYMHSVEKKGFFPHFFFGSFSTLLDTGIAEKLDIEKICFSFDGPQTLKVAVIKKGEIKNREDAIDKVRLFVISEQDAKIATQRFSYGELRNALGKSHPARFQPVFDNKSELKVKLVTINKDKINRQGVSVGVKDKKLYEDDASRDKFKKIEKGLWSKPEDDIAGLSSNRKMKVKESCEKVLKEISKVHSKYEDSLEYGKEGGKTFREAAHHGFVAGALNNFRYRHNLRVYLEQFAGRGYADIVLLARGPNRALDSIPVIIELKAGKGRGTAPGNALQQATDYAKGFQPNIMRVLTTADDILCVGVNLDYPSPISNIEAKSREGRIIPFFQSMLESTDEWNRNDIDKEILKTRIQDNIERIYHTFPGTGEKGYNHYFSRDLLGQSLLLNEVEVLETEFEKHVFIYSENIPTEIRSKGKDRGVPQREKAKEADEKLAESAKLDESHAVVSMVLIPENDEKLVYVVNVVEADGRDEILRKGVPLDNLNQKIGNRKIAELNLNFNVKKQKSDFKEYFNIEANKYDSIEQYNNKRTDKFQGVFKDIPYPNELKETFDRALNSQLTSAQSSSIDEYNKLFKKVGEAIFPFKSLVNGENDFQGVLDGAFSHYSDLRLQESPETRALVLTEFQTGRGKRADMLVHGIKFEGDAKEYIPIGLELKGPRGEIGVDALKREANDQITKEYERGVTYKTLTDGDEVKFIGVVFDKKASDANSLVLASRTSEEGFIPVKVVHSSIHIVMGEHLEKLKELAQRLGNMAIQEENWRTLESATVEKDYHYWLQQHDMADIARVQYSYGIDTLFEVVGSPEHIASQLQQFQNSVRGGEKRPLTLIVNLDNNHWVTLVISYQNGQYSGYYVDSLGSNVPGNIHQVLQQAQITINDISVTQQRDGHNCGLWALENARDINAVLQGSRNNVLDEIHSHLQVRGRGEDHFVRSREYISNILSMDPQRIANLEAVLAETQQPKFDPNNCIGGGRSRRSINPCLFSKGDVEESSKGKVDENNVGKIIIDSEKFLTYVKSSQDEKKNAQLIEFVGDKSIEGDHKYLVDKVVGDQGYERYIQNERIKDLQGDVLQQNSGLTKNPKLKSRLMNAAGGIQLIRGIHGAIVSCKDGTATDCGLNLGGIGWSFASQPIENVMVKITPKVVASTGNIVGKIIPGTLGRQTKFAVQVAGVKFGSTIAKGAAGAVAGVFDVIDICISANNLVDCKKRENSDNPCGEKEIRDNIASISFSGVSFISGVALTAASMPVVGIAVGFGLMVGYGIYSGVSNIVEYKKKYDTTHGENWSIFWRTLLFQDMAPDVQHLADRKNTVNSLAKQVWKALNNSPNSVVAYGVGLGKVSGNTLRPDYATIMMNRTNTNTKNLSRVIPDRVPGASRICLPKITGQDYEKGITSSVQPPLYYCENAMVISHDGRNGKTIVYDLRNIDKGEIVGSNKWNNNFLIYPGTTKITGGNNVANRFVLVNNPSFSGKIIGGNNSTNILDLSQLAEDKVTGVIDYRFKPSTHGQLKIKINNRLLIDDYVGSNFFNYHYIGRKNKVDEILCMGYSEHFTGIDDRDVIIDSSGGSNKNEKDVVENCKKVIISPYTTVKGGKSNYTFYVKAADYKGKGLYSEIDVDGTGTVIFPEIDLLGDCDQITYSTNSNTLSLKINFGQNNQFTLDVKNYVEQSSNKPHFALIDKNGSNIVPKIERSDSSTIKITSFELHSEHSLDNFDDVASHYKKILNNNKDYKVFSVIRDRVQNQGNSAVPHMVFGSLENDVINFDQGTMFARGGGGSDVYFISNDISSREVKIDNNSSDKKLDTLFMSAVEKDFSIQQCDLYLKYNNSSIRVKNYFQDPNYRHLIIMNKKGETFIPNIQSMLCSPSSSGKGKLVPFLQATQTQNMFLLPKDFQGDHVVIDSRLEDIEKYKDKDDLLLIRERRENEIPFIIRIEGFYTKRNKWKNISYSLWNNNDLFLSSGLLENVDNVVEYKDKLRGDYERIVKEYIEDFSDSTSIIQHNQKLEKNISTSVEQDEEQIGVMVLKNITPDQVEVSSSGTDLIFRDKKSNHTININNWNNSESYRISTLEFDLGLEPITIRKLDRFGLPEVRKIQALIDKASENYQNRSKYTPKVENDFKCLVSVDDFERENRDPAHQCLGFPSLQDRVSFTENSCSLEQIEELKNMTSNSNQILTLLEKLENNLLLNGYDSNIIDQCNKWMISSGLGVLKPLVSTAVYEGKWDEVKTLLDKTAKKSNVDIEHKNQCSQKWTPLHYAIYNGNVELSESLFKSFLEKKGDINALTSCNDDNWALSHYAVHYGNLDMIIFFIDKGANIDIQSKKGKTLLYLAVEEAKQNKLDIIKLLLDRGADIKIKYNGRTPLYLAAYNSNLDIITLFCDRIKAESNNSFKIEQIKFLKEEVINQADISSNTKRLVQSCISSLRSSIKSEAERVLKDGMLNGRSASTIEFVNKVYNFDKNLFGEVIKEAVNCTYSSVGIEGILKFIGSYNYIGQFIPGYIAVFDKIPENDGTMFKLAYSIRETMTMPSVNSEEKSDLEKLKNKLPESVRNAVFSSEVCIKNVEYGRYLYSPNDYSKFQFDSDRRYVFTWHSMVGKDGKWKVELDGDNVYLKNVKYGRYLYSPNDYSKFQFESDRRYVFTWHSMVGKDDKWKVELDGDNVYLKNVKYGRYLYSPNDYSKFQFDSDRRYVFTWPSNGGSGQFKWKFENCGSTIRKVRDVINQGVDTNARDSNDETSLHMTIQHSNADVGFHSNIVRVPRQAKSNSEISVYYIKGVEDEGRRVQINLASSVKATGKFQGVANKIILNRETISHLNKVREVSGILMRGMIAKNALADFLSGDYKGVAINLGFIGGGQGFAKVAEAASLKGLKLASEGKLLLSSSLRAASPFLARVTSAFVVYDLVNQIKELESGDKDALIPVIGDSIYLGVDAAEIGIEVAEAFEALEGVSSVTGPIGAAIGAVVFIGTDVYMAVKRVDRIDEIVHLTGGEKFIEGLRAFVGMQPEQYVEELMDEKQANNQLVKQGLEYLKQHNDIQGYVFPTGGLVIDSDQEVSHKLQMDLDNLALLGNIVDHVIWHRAKPDNPNVGKLFCLPTGPIRPEVGGENAYLCHNAIGLFYLADRTGNSTLIALGKGRDRATGFRDSPNIFLVDDGNKELTGGDKDDVFILVGNKTIGTLDGGDGNNTLNLAGFALDKDYINVNFNLFKHYGLISSSSNDIRIKNMNIIYGRKGKQDIVNCGCDVRYIDGQGGLSNNSPDNITIPYCYRPSEKKIIVRPSTEINNLDQSSNGNFDYIILPDKGKANINIETDFSITRQRKHNFSFNYTLFDLASVDIKNIKDINHWHAGYRNMTHTIRNVTFSFLSPLSKGKSINEKFDITISDIPANASYILSDNTDINIGKNNLYAMHSTDKTIDEVVQSYPTVADHLRMSLFVSTNNETVVMGHGNHDIINNNFLQKSHLIGSGGENVYVVTSGHEILDIENLPIPEVIIYGDFKKKENSRDTLDLRQLIQQVNSNLSIEPISKITKDKNDLLIKLSISATGLQQDVVTVGLKDALVNSWYKELQIILNNAPMKIDDNLDLSPLPLTFDEEIIVVTSKDVEEKDELIISKEAGQLTFLHSEYDLMITNAFNADVETNKLCTICLKDFYREPKMETLSIKFTDKEILLSDETDKINNADSISDKLNINDYISSIVKLQESSEPSEAASSNRPIRHKRHKGHGRHEDSTHRIRHEHHRMQEHNSNYKDSRYCIDQPEMATSSGTRPSSWIKGLLDWIKEKGGGLISSVANKFSTKELENSKPRDTDVCSAGLEKMYSAIIPQSRKSLGVPKGNIPHRSWSSNREKVRSNVTVVPEINTAVVDGALILGDLAVRLVNGRRYKQPIHENLLSPRERSMRCIDEDMIIRAIQQGKQKFGVPGTNMDEVEIIGNKTEIWK